MITIEGIVPALTRGQLMVLRLNGRKRTVVDARKIGRQSWRLEFTAGPAATFAAGSTFHRLAR